MAETQWWWLINEIEALVLGVNIDGFQVGIANDIILLSGGQTHKLAGA